MKKQYFKRVILYARQYRANEGIHETLNGLIDYLTTKKLEIFQDEDTAKSFNLDLEVLPRKKMQAQGDLIIVVGGDGSLLSAARMAITVNVPVIGINRGKLGFLTDISPQNYEEELSGVLQGDFIEEKRFLLKTKIFNKKKIYFESNALNDVVLSRGMETHLIAFDVLINNQFVSHYRSDGLILATPTGSTAYALSAGGPIMHPDLNAIVVVPMFSHSLSSRPLVIDGNAKIVLNISETNENDLQISCDGHESQIVKPGQSVAVQKATKKLRLLHPTNYLYYDTLRIKLGWGKYAHFSSH